MVRSQILVFAGNDALGRSSVGIPSVVSIFFARTGPRIPHNGSKSRLSFKPLFVCSFFSLCALPPAPANPTRSELLASALTIACTNPPPPLSRELKQSGKGGKGGKVRYAFF